MRNIKRKILAVIMASALGLSIIPASASTNDSLKSIQKSGPATNYRIPVGSFIQDFMTWGWSDERWQQELDVTKKAGMEYLIFSPSVIIDGTKVKTNYPSQIPEFKDKNMYGNHDTIDDCLRNCEKAGIKVFIALNQDPKTFWNLGWKISTTSPERFTQYWKDNAAVSNKVADELYSMYKTKYKNAFYGWYWVHEFWNYTICTSAYEGKPASDTTAADPTVYTDIIAKEAFNPVLDHLTQIDKSMPMLFSSFANPALSKPESQTRFWTDIIKNTKFRPGDIMAPMDGMGGGVMTLDTLDTWTAATKKASEANSNLHFWINNEEFVTNALSPNGSEVATIDRLVKQVSITSKYAEKNVFFTWNHYYGPYNTMPGYCDTYMQYIKTGEIEKNAPDAVDAASMKITKDGTDYKASWSTPKDDIGVAYYNIYKDGVKVARLHCGRIDTGTDPKLYSFYETDEEGNYQISAEDFAGNESPKTAFVIGESALTTASSTTTTGSTTVSTKKTGSTDTNPSAVSTTEGSDITVDTTAASNGSDNNTDSGNTTSESPKTGSELPKAAILFAVVTAAIGFAVKSKKEK